MVEDPFKITDHLNSLTRAQRLDQAHPLESDRNRSDLYDVNVLALSGSTEKKPSINGVRKLTTDNQTKEAKIKELIARANSPRDQAFYEGLLKKVIAERPKQVVEVFKSLKSEDNSKQASVAEKKTASVQTESGQSKSSKKKKKSEKDSKDSGLASEANSSVKQTKEAKSQKQKSNSKSKSQKKTNFESKEQENQKPPRIFQAIGVIKGKIVYSFEKLKIQMGDWEYELQSAPPQDKRRKFEGLKQEVKEKGSCQKVLVVYPFVYHFLEAEKQKRRVAFKVVTSKDADPSTVIWNELMEREFKFSGIWNYITHCGDEPCITIKRNWSPSLVKYLEKMSKQQKAKKLRPFHLPVEWLDAPVEAFKYAQKSSEVSQKPWFVTVKAVFVPEEDKFKVVEQLAEPSQTKPRYLKA